MYCMILYQLTYNVSETVNLNQDNTENSGTEVKDDTREIVQQMTLNLMWNQWTHQAGQERTQPGIQQKTHKDSNSEE